MPNEKPIVLPLSGEEVREAILFKLNESLKKTCHLIDSSAYTAFRGKITISLVLVDYGRETVDNHIVEVDEDVRTPDATDAGRAESYEEVVDIPAMPPNQVRVETQQSVPVQTNVGGKVEVRKVKYAARKSKAE